MSEGQKSRRRSGLGGAALVMFAGLAPAGAACGLAGDETAFVGSCAFRDYGEDQRAELCTWPASDHQHDPGQRRTSVHHAAPAVRTPQAFASADNPAGKDVWDAGAHKTFPGTHMTCPGPGPVPSWTWAANYSDTQEFDWSQDDCTEGPACRVTRIRAVRVLRCPPARTGSSVNSTGATGAPPATVRQRRPPSPSPARPRSIRRRGYTGRHAEMPHIRRRF